MTNGGLVLLPPPHLQPGNETSLTLVQTVDTLTQQLETFLQKNKKEKWHGTTGILICFGCQENTASEGCASKPTFAIVFKL